METATNPLHSLLKLLIRDNTPLEEVKQILRVWPKDALGAYFHLRHIEEERKDGSDNKKAEEWNGVFGPEKSGGGQGEQDLYRKA